MSRIRTAVCCGQLLAATLVVVSGGMAAPAAAQSSLADQTCRAALGDNFRPGSGTPYERCCMVAEEQDWYQQHGVAIARVYVRADRQKVRPKACSAAELTALLAAGAGTQPPGTEQSQSAGQSRPDPTGQSEPAW